MATRIINRGRGPEIEGTRITVLNLIPYLEDGFGLREIQDILSITPGQLEAALAYLEENRETLMEMHRRIEERNARGNPPEVQEKLAQSSRRLALFKEWLDLKKQEGKKNGPQLSPSRAILLQQFEDWLKTRERAQVSGT